MYNNHDMMQDDKRYTQFNPQQAQQDMRQDKLTYQKPRNIMNLTQKSVGINGTYGRIVPKGSAHDYERLYAENIQLKEKIRSLLDQQTRIKTRMSINERQKQHLMSQLGNIETNYPLLKDRRPSVKNLSRPLEKTKKASLDENRKILHNYKDQITKLQVENARLKKTVKYTQIQQMETENQCLHQEIIRIKQYAQNIIDNTEYDEYERQIQLLRKQLEDEKNNSKSLLMELKKKNEEVEEHKNKLKVLASRKVQLQKKYNRDISSAKNEVHKAKEREKSLLFQAESTKARQIVKSPDCHKCSGLNQELQGLKIKMNELLNTVANKNNQISELQTKSNQLQETVKNSSKNQNNIQQQNVEVGQYKSDTNKTQSNKAISQKPSQNLSKRQQKSNPKIEPPIQKQIKKIGSESNYVSDISFEEDSQIQPIVSDTNKSNEQERPKQHSKSNKMKLQKSYSNSFEDDPNGGRSGQNNGVEVLFQKPEPQKKENGRQISNNTSKKSEAQPKKGKQGLSKAERILHETVKYRMISQRYTYEDFSRDIKNSGTAQFSAEQLIEMLSNEPFFLNEEHLRMVIFSLFESEQIEPDYVIKTNQFLKKMQKFIGDIELLEEKDQEQLLKRIRQRLGKKKLLQKLQIQAGGKEISKKGFVKVLKQHGLLDDQQVQQCLAEASVLSNDIAHINYEEFIQKMKGDS